MSFKRIFIFLFLWQAIKLQAEIPPLPSEREISNTPPEIKKLLDENAADIEKFVTDVEGYKSWLPKLRGGASVITFKWLPNAFIKHGPERYFNHLMLKWFIEENDITTFTVAPKFLYHLPGRPNDISDDNYLVVSLVSPGFLEDTRPYNRIFAPTSEKQKQDYQKIITIYERPELRPTNYLINADNKVIIIDTDFIAMEFSWEKFETAKSMHERWLKSRADAPSTTAKDETKKP